ncbi:class I SAM-dependent methyltransferase [Actinomadura hibisca]|uniref:class I SAM-dependent methyltransferase n=1 Tax=Actinomadura hibisca TaxID=68565 RepID=UPI000830085B|nr:class I SAM-dependent methyltransferase [Actinomadura hibisca]
MPHTPSELFVSTAPYYRYRPGYSPELFEYLRERFHLDGTKQILDLGTGPGVLALPLSRYAATIIAVDPEPGMLDQGRALAAQQQINNIDWRLGDSTTLRDLNLSPVDLAVMGAAFHWMDRDQTLADLDELVAPDGALVLVSGGVPGSVQPPTWLDAITQVRTRYLGEQRRAGSGTYTHPKELHQDVLARSAFSHLETVCWDRTVTYTLDQLIGLQFSYSYSSPAQLGPAKDAFKTDLRAALTHAEPGGQFDEVVRTEAIIATRP